MAPSICVVGSINIDMNAYVPRFPAAGETLHGKQFTTGYGGKGANQAVMAARLGGSVTMVGRVGDDIFGRDMRNNLQQESINTGAVFTSTGVSSGVAVITVSDAGENMIIVIAGANGEVNKADIENARPAITTADVLVCQMEIPLEANFAALRMARLAGVRTIFNPAPAVADLPDTVLQLVDICSPNETELEILTGQKVRSRKDAVAAAGMLIDRGAGSVIVTLGAQGSLLVERDHSELVPAPKVKAVDTTGAGDAFIGGLAHYLAAGRSLVDAMRRANEIAAISVQSPGTQASYPQIAELPDSPPL